jgi:CRP-like cAMP-binding protein
MRSSTTWHRERGVSPSISPDPGQTTLIRTLRDHIFTRGLEDSQIAALASVACQVMFAEGEIVLEDREQSRAFYLLLSGSVSVELCTANYVVSVQALGPGETFGWSAFLNDHETLFQVRARENTTALRLEGKELRALFQNDPVLAKEILERALAVVAGRVRATEIRFAEMCGIRV